MGNSKNRLSLLNQLTVYRQAKKVNKICYELAKVLPGDEKYGLISQLKRACISIVANIAESQGRSTKADRNRFLFIAKGSICEVVCLLDMCVELEILEQTKITEPIILLQDLEVRLYNFIHSK